MTRSEHRPCGGTLVPCEMAQSGQKGTRGDVHGAAQVLHKRAYISCGLPHTPREESATPDALARCHHANAGPVATVTWQLVYRAEASPVATRPLQQITA